MSLFGGATSQVRSRNLVEFKAGKMNLRGNMVLPDKRKGLVYLHQGNDMLMHLCWKDRSSNTAEDDLVIFPDEIEFKKVTQNTTGRVYILKWKLNARKFFFWMQEPTEDKDEEYCKKINELLNHPPTPSFGDSGSSGAHPLQPLMERMSGAGGAGGIDPNDLSNVLRGMNPNELASLLSSFGGGAGGGAAGLMQGIQRGGRLSGSSSQQGTSSSRANPLAQRPADSRPNTAPSATRTSGTPSTSANRSNNTSSSKPRSDGTSSSSASAVVPNNTGSSTTSGEPKSSSIQMSALTNVLANLNNNSTQGTETAASSKPAIDTATSENLIPLLSNKDVQAKLRTHLPEGHIIPNTEKELKESISSPQFQQVLTAFSAALRARELESVLTQLHFPVEVTNAAHQGDLLAFAQALGRHYKNVNKSSDNTMDTN